MRLQKEEIALNKRFVRIVCWVLVLILALSLVPVAALAAEEGTTEVVNGVFDSPRATKDNLEEVSDPIKVILVGNEKIVVDAADYNALIRHNGAYYDLVGLHTLESLQANRRPSRTVTLAPYDAMSFEEWYASYAAVILAYVPHVHRPWNDQWFFSDTNHWQYCELCKEVFNMNWHHDKDENDVCDDCQEAIHYYDITVAETTGGKVEVSTDKAKLNERVNVTITPDSGYKVKSIAFYNNNEQHSQVCQYMDVPYSEYHFIVLPWDVEVVVEFEAE